MDFNAYTLGSLMRAVRVKSDAAKQEIEELAEACVLDLNIAGVYVTDPSDPLTLQALKLYCKANFGYDSETDTKRFQASYEHLKTLMALSGDYEKGE